MIYCVRFIDVEAFLHDCGFQLAGETDAHLLYSRPSGIITIHKPNTHGDVTLIEIEGACDAAGLTPPSFETHWCD